VTTTRRSEIDWLYRGGVAPLFPEQWHRFRSGVPQNEQDGDLVEAYYSLLHDPDLAIRIRAARNWCEWEESLFSTDPDAKPDARRLEPAFQLAFARIVTHYFRHDAWLEEGVLLKEANVLSSIPGIMIHGRLDVGAPLVTAWQLNKAWPNSELVLVSGAGHSSADPGMTEAIISATDRFAHI
jgi:proline iminopeptidase